MASRSADAAPDRSNAIGEDNVHIRKSLTLRCLLLIALTLSWGTSQVWGQSTKKDKDPKVTRDQVYKEKFKKIPPSEQKKAAKLAASVV